MVLSRLNYKNFINATIQIKGSYKNCICLKLIETASKFLLYNINEGNIYNKNNV